MRFAPVVLAMLCVATLFIGLDRPGFLDWREARDAEVTRELLLNSEALTPLYGSAALYEKPVLAYSPEVWLSRFTGAARELRDALLVNPYDVDGTAEAIRTAIEMSPAERRGRMLRMRQTVREHNIYRWAGLLLGELAGLPAEDVGGRPG